MGEGRGRQGSDDWGNSATTAAKTWMSLLGTAVMIARSTREASAPSPTPHWLNSKRYFSRSSNLTSLITNTRNPRYYPRKSPLLCGTNRREALSHIQLYPTPTTPQCSSCCGNCCRDSAWLPRNRNYLLQTSLGVGLSAKPSGWAGCLQSR